MMEVSQTGDGVAFHLPMTIAMQTQYKLMELRSIGTNGTKCVEETVSSETRDQWEETVSPEDTLWYLYTGELVGVASGSTSATFQPLNTSV